MSSRRRLAVALVGALVLGGSLIGASRLGTEEGAASPSEPLPSILDGIPQSGTALGSPEAPVTLVEYADLQCPYCAEWTHRTFPALVDQYVNHPLTSNPGEIVRFWVVAAGPTLDTNFHVVGTVFDRAWSNGDMTRFQSGVQTVGVPAGGGGVFDVKIDEEGLYPFVSHAFAHVDLGQVGLLKVGNPAGTMSH